MHRPGRILAGVLVAASIAFAALPARAISPVLIMVYGGGLTKSIFVKDTIVPVRPAR